MSDLAQNGFWRRIDRAARTVETWLIVLILGGLIVFGAAQIVLRNFFSIGFSWGDGLTRLAVLWLGLLGALAASRDGRHITMGALARWLPERLRVPAGLWADWFGGVVSAVLAWYSWAFVRDSREFGDLLLGDVVDSSEPTEGAAVHPAGVVFHQLPDRPSVDLVDVRILLVDDLLDQLVVVNTFNP